LSNVSVTAIKRQHQQIPNMCCELSAMTRTQNGKIGILCVKARNTMHATKRANVGCFVAKA